MGPPPWTTSPCPTPPLEVSCWPRSFGFSSASPLGSPPFSRERPRYLCLDRCHRSAFSLCLWHLFPSYSALVLEQVLPSDLEELARFHGYFLPVRRPCLLLRVSHRLHGDTQTGVVRGSSLCSLSLCSCCPCLDHLLAFWLSGRAAVSRKRSLVRINPSLFCSQMHCLGFLTGVR